MYHEWWQKMHLFHQLLALTASDFWFFFFVVFFSLCGFLGIEITIYLINYVELIFECSLPGKRVILGIMWKKLLKKKHFLYQNKKFRKSFLSNWLIDREILTFDFVDFKVFSSWKTVKIKLCRSSQAQIFLSNIAKALNKKMTNDLHVTKPPQKDFSNPI